MSRIILAITVSIIIVIGIGAFFIDRALDQESRKFFSEPANTLSENNANAGVFIKDNDAIFNYR